MSSEIEEIRQRKMNEMMKKMNTSASGDDGWPDAPVQLTDASFDEFVKKHPKVVIDCWAPWCGPCRMLSPTIDAMANDMKGKIAFGKLNTDENYGTAGKYRIMSIPTLLVFKDGKLVDRLVGAAPRTTIEAQLMKSLG
jgi:thioredoxin 1